MIDFILQIFIWWMIFEAVFFVARWYFNYRMESRIDQEITGLLKEVRENCKLVSTEVVDNVHLMYDQLTGDFVCQGNSEAELWQRAKQRFPNKEFVVKENADGVPTFKFRRER